MKTTQRPTYSLSLGLVLLSLLVCPTPARAFLPGELDLTFSGTGFTITDILIQEEATSVAVQPDGKIVVGGSISIGEVFPRMFVFARYLPEGPLDPKFGAGGWVLFHLFDGTYHEIMGIALQSDGKILAVGTVGFPMTQGLVILRFLSDGTPDLTFGKEGVGYIVDTFHVEGHLIPLVGGVSKAAAIALQEGGGETKIVVAGTYRSSEDSDNRFALARYTLTGELDLTFGDAGHTITEFLGDSGSDSGKPLSAKSHAMVLDADGKILVAGEVLGFSLRHSFALARYNKNGKLDETFGKKGRVTTGVVPGPGKEARADSIALQPDGRIILAGSAGDLSSDRIAAGLARFLPNGDLDPNFGGGTGIVVTRFGGSRGTATGLHVQPDGKIVATGWITQITNPLLSEQTDFALLRYDSKGDLDPSFGLGGIVLSEFDFSHKQLSLASAPYPPDKIVLAGFRVGPLKMDYFKPAPLDIAVARYCLFQTSEFPVSGRDCENSPPPPNPSSSPNLELPPNPEPSPNPATPSGEESSFLGGLFSRLRGLFR